MKFFLDTANLSEIEKAAQLNIIDGVTTNPSLMAKEGIKDFEKHYKTICQIVKGPVSAEVIATDFEGMVEEGRKFAQLDPNIVVKIPMTAEGLKAIAVFSKENIQTNCTLVFSSGQGILAAKAGATYISPFVGRLDDIGHDGLILISELRKIFDNYNISTQILAASLRHTPHVIQCMIEGADVATLPYNVLMGLIKHPLTDIGLEKFLKDHAEAMKKLQ